MRSFILILVYYENKNCLYIFILFSTLFILICVKSNKNTNLIARHKIVSLFGWFSFDIMTSTSHFILQSAKILLVPQKCKIIIVLSNCYFPQYCNTRLLTIAPCIVITLDIVCFFLAQVLCSFLDLRGDNKKFSVIIERATTMAVTICKAIWKRGNHTKPIKKWSTVVKSNNFCERKEL